MSAVIKNIKIENLVSKVDPKYRRYISKNLQPQKVSFELHNANVAIANGLRRTLLNETIVKSMIFDLMEFKCSYPFMLNNFILDRMRSIPLLQSTPIDATFTLSIANNTDGRIKQIKNIYNRIKRDYGKLTTEEEEQMKKDLANAENPSLMFVYSGDIEWKGKQHSSLPFNETFQIAILEPGTSLEIPTIKVNEGYGYEHASFSLTASAYSKALDQIPLDLYTKKGISSSVSDPRVHEIGFVSNGIMDANEMIKYACKTLIERLTFIKGMTNEIVMMQSYSLTEGTTTTPSNEHSYQLEVKDESHTIGNILMKTICDIENIESVNYTVDNFTRKFTLKLKTSSDVKKILERSIDFAITNLKAL